MGDRAERVGYGARTAVPTRCVAMSRAILHTAPVLVSAIALLAMALTAPCHAQQFREFGRAGALAQPSVTESLGAIVDIDGDGDSDVVAIGRAGREILLEQLHDGSFARVGAVPWPASAIVHPGGFGVWPLDLDCDGVDESVFVGQFGGAVIHNFATGLGSANGPSLAIAGLGAKSGDLDGDGFAEVVAHTGVLVVLRGAPVGTPTQWTDVTTFHLSPAAAQIRVTDHEVTDIDGDGDIDIVALSQSGITILVNDGQGVFVDESSTRIGAQSPAWPLVMADTDGDGAPELVVGTDPCEVYQNDGQGRFSLLASIAQAGEGGPRPIALDLDGDGDSEILAREGSMGMRIFSRVRGTAQFTSIPAFQPGRGDSVPMGRLVSAVTRPGVDALLVHGQPGSHPRSVIGGPMSVAYRAGNQPFWLTARETGLAGVEWPLNHTHFAFGDLDGDGWVEALTTGRILELGPSGSFGDRRSFPESVGHQSGWQLADMNGDGALDALAEVRLGGLLTVQLNDGAGELGPVAQGAAARSWGLGFVVGDLDRDGDLDVVRGDTVFLNDGSGIRFATSTRAGGTLNGTDQAHLVDLDGDGRLDLAASTEGISFQSGAPADFLPALPGTAGHDILAVAELDPVTGPIVFAQGRTGARRIELWAFHGSRDYVDEASLRLPRPIDAVHFAKCVDVDGDGDVDVLIGAAGGSSVLVNDGSGHFFERPFGVAVANGCTSRTSSSPCHTRYELLDIDRDGDMDLVRPDHDAPFYAPQVYINRHRDLWAPRPMRAGLPFDLEVGVRPGYGTGTLVAPLVAFGLAPTSLDLGPLGLLHLDPASAVALPPLPVGTSGRAVLRLDVPAGTIGLDVHFQALVGAPDFALTGLVSETVVP